MANLEFLHYFTAENGASQTWNFCTILQRKMEHRKLGMFALFHSGKWSIANLECLHYFTSENRAVFNPRIPELNSLVHAT